MGTRKKAEKDTGKKGKVVAYLRVSTTKQDTENQMMVINEYCEQKGIKVDETIKVELSSRRSRKERLIDSLLHDLRVGDTLIVVELSRLGRSLVEVVETVNTLIRKQVKFVAIKQGMEINGKNDMCTKMMIGMFSLMAEIERDLISERTKAGLVRARAEGKKLGNPNLSLTNESYRRGAQEFAEVLRPTLDGLRGQGYSQRRMVEELNKLGVKARHGGQWSLIQLQNVLKRLEPQQAAA
jgi:DNA invertase Pin-like site-specific DNA recombinase